MNKLMLHALAVAALALSTGCAQQTVASRTESTATTAPVNALKMAKDEGAIDKAFFNQVVADKVPNIALVDVRTKFEFAAGHFPGSTHLPIDDLNSEGCPSTMARLPKAGFIVFVCATGARAGEM